MRINFSKHGYGTQEPPELSIPVETPSLLSDLVKLHTKDLGYSLSDLSTLLHMDQAECCEAFMPRSGLRLISTVLRMA